MRIVPPVWHGALDYALAITFIFVPGVLGFTHAAANLSQMYGVAYLAASLLTRYPLAAVRMIPFPLHGILESIMAATWIAVPWVFGFAAADPVARNFFVAAGVGLLGLALLTDYRSTQPARAYVGTERRRNLLDRRERFLAVRQDRRRNERDRRAYSGA